MKLYRRSESRKFAPASDTGEIALLYQVVAYSPDPAKRDAALAKIKELEKRRAG